MHEHEGARIRGDRHLRRLPRDGVHQLPRPRRPLRTVRFGAQGIAEEQIRVSRALNHARVRHTIRAEGEHAPALRHPHRDGRHAMLRAEELDGEAADLAAITRPDRHALDCGVDDPLRETGVHQRGDARVRVRLRVDRQRNVREKKRRHPARVIQVAVRDDHVAESADWLPDTRQLPGQLEAAAGVDQERLAAVGSDEQPRRAAVWGQW